MRATFRFASGIEGVAEFGFRGFYTPRGGVSVAFENGWIKWDSKGLVYEKNSEVIHESFSTTSSYQLQLDDFVRRIRGKKSTVLAPEEAVLTARIVDAMYEKAGLALRGAPQA
jgi:predicted dehydrogenase